MNNYGLRKLSFMSGLVLFFSVYLLLSPLHTNKASAVYDGSRIIDDSIFLNSTSMSSQDIQNFLTARGGAIANASFLMDCNVSGSQASYGYQVLGAPCGQNTSAANIIYYSAQIYGLNPRVILATMQKEQSLITATNPTNRQYVQAMGYGCPTTGSCDDTSNFFWQVDNGTWVLRWHYERARGNFTWWRTSSSWTCGNKSNDADYSFYRPGLNPGQAVTFYDGLGYRNTGPYTYVDGNGNTRTGGVAYRTYTLSNAATSAFYCYTPHAYNNPQGLYGRAAFGTTGQYYSGSYNFVYWYDIWFGSTWADAYSAQPVWQSVFTDSTKATSLGWNATLRVGQSAYAVVQMRNTGSSTWYRQNGNLETMLGTTGGQDRASVFCHPSWVHACNRMARLNESSVAPGQIGTFEFPITAPGGAGTYNESFGVVVNGSGYFQSYNTFQFTVEPERNTAQPVWQSVFTDSTKATSLGWNATLRVGQSAYAVVQMRNTGNTTWTRTGSSFDAMLGTVNGQDRTSGFCGNTWLFPCKRPARLNESSVAPGQIGTFEFPISAPGEPGVYSESFGVVINGKGYFPNGYNTFQFTVEPERNTAQPVWQSVFTDSTKATSLGWNATLAPGQSAFVVILAKNTGNLSWTKSGGTNDTMLGTVLSQDRQSLFCTIGWLHPCNRPVGLKESTIAPGQTGTFEFAVTAPTTRGIYNENFGFVVNGKGYFSSGSVNVQFTIN